MPNLRDLQESVEFGFNDQGLDLEAVHAYPDRNSISFHIMRNFSDFGSIGFFYGFGSTGGRMHYQDQQSEISLDQIVSYHSMGLELNISLSSKPFQTFIYAKPTYFISSLEQKEKVVFLNETPPFFIQESSDSVSEQLSVLQFGFEPGIMFRIPCKAIFVDLHLGYMLSPQKHLSSTSTQNTLFIDSIFFNDLSIDWSGVRFGLSVGFE